MPEREIMVKFAIRIRGDYCGEYCMAETAGVCALSKEYLHWGDEGRLRNDFCKKVVDPLIERHDDEESTSDRPL